MEKVVLSTGNNEYNIIDSNDIVYLLGDGAYTYIHLLNKEKHITCKCLKVIEKELDSPWFFRINQNYLINIKHIKKYKISQPYTLTMMDGEVQLASRSGKKMFKEKVRYMFKHI